MRSADEFDMHSSKHEKAISFVQQTRLTRNDRLSN